jgi:hypothetical protein
MHAIIIHVYPSSFRRITQSYAERKQWIILTSSTNLKMCTLAIDMMSGPETKEILQLMIHPQILQNCQKEMSEQGAWPVFMTHFTKAAVNNIAPTISVCDVFRKNVSVTITSLCLIGSLSKHAVIPLRM